MYSVLYFDGKKSDPHSVEMEVGERSIRLISSKGNTLRQFSYKDITHLNKIGQKYQLELIALITGDAVELIEFEGIEIYNLVQRYRQLHSSSIAKSIFFFDRQNLAGKLTLTFGLGAGFLLLVFLAFSNIHFFIPKRYDLYLGEKIEKQLLRKAEVCESDSLLEFINKVEEVLSMPEDNFKPKIHLVNYPLVNAVAFPGGKIFLFKGLVKVSESPEEVIAVLAHEMEHAERRHGIKQMSRSVGMAFMASMVIGMAVEGVEIFEAAEFMGEILSTLLYLKYSRGFEEEADKLAVKRLHSKEITAQGMADFFKRLDSLSKKEDKKEEKKNEAGNITENQGKIASEQKGEEQVDDKAESLSSWFQTHPQSKKRYTYIQKAVEAESFGPNPLLAAERANWNELKNSCPDSKKPLKIWKLIF